MQLTKEIKVPRGKNIGNEIINSFKDFHRIIVLHIEVARDTVNKTNNASLIYTYK